MIHLECKENVKLLWRNVVKRIITTRLVVSDKVCNLFNASVSTLHNC